MSRPATQAQLAHRRAYKAPPDDDRCVWDITLRGDKSAARCMRRGGTGGLCTQHAKMRAAWSCVYCGGNDENPPDHCMDCTRPIPLAHRREVHAKAIEAALALITDGVGVHVTHCCPKYGCKYGREDCPVENKRIKPAYRCEECSGKCELLVPKPVAKPRSLKRITSVRLLPHQIAELQRRGTKALADWLDGPL